MAIGVRSAKDSSGEASIPGTARRLVSRARVSVWLSLLALASGSLTSVAQSQPPATKRVEAGQFGAQSKTAPSTPQSSNVQLAGNVSGTVIDKEGALAVGAKVQISGDKVPTQEVVSGDNGEFSFSNVPPGAFHLTVSAPGFNTQEFSGDLAPGQAYVVPPIVLPVAEAVTEVRVGGDAAEVAEVEVKQELQQRVFGIIPNFYVTYTTDPPPLFAKQKFQLAWRSVIDPVTLAGVGFLAGVEQAGDQFGGYGQGAAGYGRRFGAAYGDVVFGTFIGSAILPTVLKQDPRYFYQGTGTKKSRLLHAIENSVVARNDVSKKWEPNYSGIIGSFAAGAISYTYYPVSDRNTGLYVENSLIRLGESSVAGIIQEFVLRKFTSHVPPADPPAHP